jgi:hypothetical protein
MDQAWVEPVQGYVGRTYREHILYLVPPSPPICVMKYGVFNGLERSFAPGVCNDWTSLHLYPNKGTYGQATSKRHPRARPRDDLHFVCT